MPEKPLLEYANRLKSFWLFPVVFIFFVSALFSLIQLKQSIAILDKRHDTSVWTIFQLRTELQRFHDSLIIYEKDQSTLVELQERYDILWSRFPVILNSIDGERLSESNGSIEIVEQAFAEVKALEPVIFEELALNPALTSSIRLRIRPHLEAITILSLDNYLKHNDYLSRSDDRVTGLQEKLVWLMFGLILSGSLLLLMVLRENRFNLYQAEHDSLTGMPNRAYLRRVLSDRCGIGQPYALHLIDLNGFKDINDTLGHHAGDLVLQAVAKRLKDKIDNFFDCVTCRLGGDEFAIVQFDVMTKKQLNTLASQVISVLTEEFDLGEHQCHIGASIGSSLYPDHGRDGSSLLSHADIAMYQAKVNAPESTHKLFSYQMLEQINRRQQLQRELRNAIHNGELHLEYQPIVCLQKK
ncbi:MAG: diguanylate cyclase domain-containing protein [Neptuniibacter sp.]